MATPAKNSDAPEALLFVAPGCPYCAGVLRGLEQLFEQGRISKLTVLDVTEHPEQAQQYAVRTTPWLRLGPFTLTGAHSPAELGQWAAWAYGTEGTVRYVEYLLQQGGYRQAAAFIDADTQRLAPLLAIIADPEAKLQVRLGASALLESYARTAVLQRLIPELARLARHADHRVRADACHLLGLTGSAAARPAIAERLNDASPEVREIAEEALESLPGD